jgi:methylglutaconyl-CoA hydratase
MQWPHVPEQAALEVLEQSLSKAPLALAAAKAAVNDGFEVPLEKGLAFERAHYTGLFGTQDRLEALRAFAEKRPPGFEGR